MIYSHSVHIVLQSEQLPGVIAISQPELKTETKPGGATWRTRLVASFMSYDVVCTALYFLGDTSSLGVATVQTWLWPA